MTFAQANCVKVKPRCLLLIIGSILCFGVLFLLKKSHQNCCPSHQKPKMLAYQTIEQLQKQLNMDSNVFHNALPDRCEEETFHFIEKLKNPCWIEKFSETYIAEFIGNPYFANKSEIVKKYVKEKEYMIQHGINIHLRCLPYYFLLGQPKSGTTDLFHRINLHPQVIEPLLKGPNWWTRRRYGFDFSNSITFSQYIDVFTPLAHIVFRAALNQTSVTTDYAYVTGDSSTSTLWDQSIVKKNFIASGNETDVDVMMCLNSVLPNKKFIVILRNPVCRLYSDYLYFSANESVCNPDKFHELVVTSIANWTICTSQSTPHDCVLKDEFIHSPVRITVGMYSVFLEQWFHYFDPKNFFVVKFEEYKRDTRASLAGVFRHLGLDDIAEEDWKVILSNPVKNKNRLHGKMHNKTADLLKVFYDRFNQQLVGLLADEKFSWADE